MSGETLDLFAEPPPIVRAPVLEAPQIIESLPAPPRPLNSEAQPLLFADLEPPPTPPESSPTIYVHFESLSDIEAFARVIGQPVTTQTRYLRFPPELDASSSWRAEIPPPIVEEDEADDEDEGATPNLFGYGEWWEEYWRGMPEFIQEDLAPRHSIQVEFGKASDVDYFGKLLDQQIPNYTKRTPSIWFPEAEIGHFAGKRWVNSTRPELRLPRYPIYIISKGRWESRLTAKALDRMGVPYHIVVEPQEYDRYAAVIDPLKILDLPFSNLGQGSIPARNWVWEHAVAQGVERHWILDDNIDGFFRLNRNLKVPVGDGTCFRIAEDFVDRFENVALAGFHYFMFASRKTKLPPLTLNSRIYSCILIRNDVPHRWRGRYNEDTDLSIRVLKDGCCTVLFSAFLAFKTTTMTMKGGNTDELYKNDGRRKMAESLQQQHPDLVRVTWKWGRWQHHVDYRKFKRTRLISKPGIVIPRGVDDCGLILEISR